MPNGPLTVFDRSAALETLRSEEFDVLVIGGGITGAGVLLDAASRGLRAALVEKDDFASGTSSKSSKMVHGGLRYLQQKEFGLVHENLVERHRLLQNAPHLVEPLPFLIPLFGKGGVVDQTVVRGYSVALWMYDMAGGWKIGKRHRKITADELASHLPTLRRDRLVAGFLYYDARADDARLTLAVTRTAVLSHGAVAVNHAPVTALTKDERDRVCGVVIEPTDEPAPIEVKARVVVNATGVWADEIRFLEDGTHPRTIRPAKGIHLTVDRAKLPCDMAAVIPVPKDRRSIFIVPWGEHTYLGTTDTDYDGPLDDPQVDDADVAYVLGAINAAVSDPLSPSDITGTWAGLRPLLAKVPGHKRPPSARTADLSRRHQVIISDRGLVTITGGKLTTYRKMAEDTVDALVDHLGRIRPSPTKRLRLRGADGLDSLDRVESSGANAVDPAVVAHLRVRYGGEARAVLSLLNENADLAAPLVDGLPYLRAEAVYAVRYEMAIDLADVLARRTRALLLDARATLGAAPAVAELIGEELGWDEARRAAEMSRFATIAERELGALHRAATS
ncbi:MAG: FAD-dependent oxidoreductase [Acidimicrobiales bacterium]|jgi:glycerol-3-phosphate dehydrogenase